MIPEPHEGHYQILATNSWAILNSWLTVREVLGKEVANMHRGINGLLELNYPYFTEKGKEFYHKIKAQIPELVESEINLVEEITE